MIDTIKKILEEYSKDKSYIIKNYSLQERIRFLEEIQNCDMDEVFSEFDILDVFDEEDSFLKIFKSEEALELLLKKQSINLESFVDMVLVDNLDDEGYKKVLDEYSDNIGNNISEIILKIQNEELKIEYFKKFVHYYDASSICNFILDIKSDILKINLLSEFKEELDDYYLLQIINSIKNLNYRFDMMVRYRDYLSMSAFEVENLKYFDDDEKIKALLYEMFPAFNSIIFKNIAISIKDDNKKKLLVCQLASKYSLDMYILEKIIISIKDINIKLEALKSVKKLIHESDIKYILLNVYDDEEKLKIIDMFYDKLEVYKTEFILSVKDIFKALIYFENRLSNNELKDIIFTIKSDELKIQAIKRFGLNKLSLSDIAYIITSINEDNLKLRIFNELEKTNDSLLRVVTSFKDDNIKIEFALQYKNTISDNYFIEIIKSIKEDELKLQIIRNLDLKVNARQQIISSIKDINLRLLIISNEAINSKSFGWLEECFLFDDELLECKVINYDLIKFYSNQVDLYYENLKLFIEKYGYIVFRYSYNDNIRKIINNDKETLDKFLALFDEEKSLKLNESSIDSIYDAIIQRIFRNNNEENIFNLFAKLKDLVIKKDKNNLIIELIKIKDSNFVDFDTKGINIEDFVSKLINDEYMSDSLNLLKNIVDEYLVKKRNVYFDERKENVYNDLNLDIVYEKNYFIKNLVSQLSVDEIISLLKQIELYNLDQTSIYLLSNQNILRECLIFKKNPTEYSGNIDTIKKYLKALNDLLDVLYRTKYYYLENKKIIIRDNSKKVFDYKKISNDEIIKLMSELDIEQLNEVLFKNEYLYKELLNILYKYKILGWDDIFEKVLKEAKIDFDDSSVASLITYFYKYYPELSKCDKIGLVNLLDEVSIYSSSSNVYKILLGKEDYELVVKNPPYNSAPMSKEDRLKRVPYLIKEMFNRKYITIPPINETIKLSENKKLSVTIGNTTDTINLTYGERTGSCMRIGGIGEDLFNLCLIDKNGFHIMITDPNTLQLVSKVSGFRNGNSVFLNQLLNNTNSNYSDIDLCEVIKYVSKTLIEKTKNSKYPIDNVFITDDGAIEELMQDTILLKENIKEGFEPFTSDISRSNAILLASSNEDNSLVDLALGTEKVEKYDVLRQKVRCITDILEIDSCITKLHLISNLINNESIGTINIDNLLITKGHSINKLFVGEDWYIAIDGNNNIIDEFYIYRNLNTLQEMNDVKSSIIQIEGAKSL